MSIQIVISNSGKIPSLCQYEHQCNPQPAFLYFDPSDEIISLDADYSAEIGNGAPTAIWNGTLLRFSVTPYATRASIEALAADEELEKKLIAIRDSYDEVWNGHNFVGHYEGLADNFKEEIEQYLADALVQGEAGSAGDWIFGTITKSDFIEKGGVKGCAAYYEELADSDGIAIIGDMEEAIAKWAEEEARDHISNNTEGSDEIFKVCELLKEYNERDYGYLVDDFNEEFNEE